MIPDILPVNNYVGNSSTTTFDFDFYIENTSQIEVYLYDEFDIKTKLVENVDYSINEVKNKNGSYITFPLQTSQHDILDENHKISISLTLPLSQETEYTNSSLLNLNTLEYSFDYLTRLIQILARKVELCVKADECASYDSSELINTIKEKVKYVSEASALVQNSLNSVTNYYNLDSQIYQNILQYKDKFDSIDEMQAQVDSIGDDILKSDGSNLTASFSDSFRNNMSQSTADYFSNVGKYNYEAAMQYFNYSVRWTAPVDGWVDGFIYAENSINNLYFDIYNPGGTKINRTVLGKADSATNQNRYYLCVPIRKGYSIFFKVFYVFSGTTEMTDTNSADLKDKFRFRPAI